MVVNHSYHIGFEFYVCFFCLQKDFISNSIRVVNQYDVMYIRKCNRAQKASVLVVLKVSYSRKEMLVFSILPKNELENNNFCPSLLHWGRNVLFVFWEN